MYMEIMGYKCSLKKENYPKIWYSHRQKSGVTYKFKRNRVEWYERYTGDSSRTFGERFKEHFKVLSPIYDHYKIIIIP